MVLLVNWNVLCWNVRGLNFEPKQLALFNAITASGCAVICLQETKKQSFDNNFIKSCCPQCFDKFDLFLLVVLRVELPRFGTAPFLWPL